MACGTITFTSERLTDGDNFLLFTGLNSFQMFENVTGRFFDSITEYPFSVSVQDSNNRVITPAFFQNFLINKRLLIGGVSVMIYTDNNISINTNANIRLWVIHTSITGFDKRVLVPLNVDTTTSGLFYIRMQSNVEFWIQKGFNLMLEYRNAIFAGQPAVATVQLNVSKIDTYANTESIFETECKKVPFEPITTTLYENQ